MNTQKEISVKEVIEWGKKKITPPKLSIALYRSTLIALTRFLESCILEQEIKNYSFVKINKEMFLKIGNKESYFLFPIKKIEKSIHFQIVNLPKYINKGRIFNIKNTQQFFEILKKLSLMDLKRLKRAQIYFDNSLANLLLGMIISFQKTKNYLSYCGKNRAAFYESLCVSGHMLYPFPKIRSNFNLNDSLIYSSENPKLIKLYLLAIPKNLGIFSSVLFNKSEDFYKKYFNFCWNKVKKYLIIPIHPWQLKNIKFIKNNILKKRLGEILPLTLPVKSLISLRTLYSPPLNLDIKLSLGTFITSEKRVIFQHRANNAPIISKIISELLKNKLLKYFKHQEDIASVRYRDFIKGPFLTSIFRKPVEPCRGTYILPATYLFDTFADKNTPPIYYEVKKFLKSHSNKKPVDFFKIYCQVLLTAPLQMFIIYGIGIEPHLQNCLIEFKKGKPISLIMRDLDGANINKRKLSCSIDLGKFSFYPFTWRLMRNDTFNKNRLFHSMVYSHLEILVSFFHDYFELDYLGLWRLARKITENIIYKNIKLVPAEFKKSTKRNTSYFLGKYVNLKCLLKMRLQKTERFITKKIYNPLYVTK